MPEDEMNYADEMFARLPVGWECEPSGRFFVEILNPRVDIPEHGWKIRINSHSLNSFPTVLRVVSEICFEEDIAIKFAKSPDALRQLHSKNIGIEIAGKALTLYAGADESVLIDLIDAKLTPPLKALSLAPANAPWSDRRISANISYRYGTYRPPPPIGGIAEPLFRDRRDTYILPHFIEDPYPFKYGVSSGTQVPETVRFYDYEISHVLYRNFGGSLYSGRSLRHNAEIVIKEAREDVMIACEVDARSLLENEYRVLKTLSSMSDIAPVPIDELFELYGHLFLSLPRISGKRLSDWQRSDAAADPSRCASIARQLAAKLTRLHETGTTHGDISLSNVIIGPDDSVSLIDFENARLDADAEDFAEDAILLSQVLSTLLGPNSTYAAAISLAAEGGRMSDILDRLNTVD